MLGPVVETIFVVNIDVKDLFSSDAHSASPHFFKRNQSYST